MHMRELMPQRHEVIEIYLAQILQGIGLGMIGIFVPIYLYTIGYSLTQAFTYVLVALVVQTLMSPVAVWLASRYGLKKTTLIRLPFFLGQQILLFLLATTDVHYLYPALLGGIAVPLYWMPLHSLFTRYSHKSNRGKEVGLMESMPALFKVVAPTIGGIIAVTFGFPVLILIAMFTMACASIPFFFTKELKARSVFEWKNLKQKGHWRFLIVETALGFGLIATGILWPLHVYFSLNSVVSVGYIATLGTLIFALTAIAIGKTIDKTKFVFLPLAMFLFAMTILPRPFLTTGEGLAGIIILGGMAGAMYITINNHTFYSIAAKKKDLADEWIVIREFYLNAGRILALLFVIIFPWQYGFHLATLVLGLTAIYFWKVKAF